MKTKEKQKKNKSYILSRYNFITFLLILMSLGIVYYMTKTTVVQAAAWNEKASKILLKTGTIEPERGKILADDGSILAANLRYYKAVIDWSAKGIKEPLFFKHLDALCDSLAVFSAEHGMKKDAAAWKKELKDKFYGMDARTVARKQRNANKADTSKYRDSYHVLFTGLTHSEYARLGKFPYLKERRNRNGFTYDTYTRRRKPFGDMARRSIGEVAEVKCAHIDTIDGVEHIDSVWERHGVSGLEYAIDSYLYGVPGITHKEQLTSTIVNWEKKPAKKGYDVMTTININIQDILEDELYKMCHESEAEWGTAILMEVKTGKIKAISSLEWNDKIHDFAEGRTHATLGYEPGSVMKVISMTMALEDGIVNNINEIITTGYSYAYAGARPITDSHGYPSMPVRKVIGASSNIGMAKIILRKYEKEPGKFYSRLKEMGFFDPLKTGIAGERRPRIDSLGNKNWDRISLSRQAYGYATQIPPLSTLAFYNAIANDGKYIRPRLVDKFLYDGEVDSVVPETYIREQLCSPTNAAKMRTMLHDVVWEEGGTARLLRDEDVEIAGKTGTCFVTENGVYTHRKRLAFCGFFPYENPQYTCMVLIQGANRGAARSSGMVLKNIALRLYSRGYLGAHADLKAGNEKAVKETTLYASAKKQSRNLEGLGMKSLKVFRTPVEVEKGFVPYVKGLSAGEAVAVLENCGLSVKLSGAGYVVDQNPKGGSEFTQGQEIQLKLSL